MHATYPTPQIGKVQKIDNASFKSTLHCHRTSQLQFTIWPRFSTGNINYTLSFCCINLKAVMYFYEKKLSKLIPVRPKSRSLWEEIYVGTENRPLKTARPHPLLAVIIPLANVHMSVCGSYTSTELRQFQASHPPTANTRPSKEHTPAW
jgi:hypothetical protein